MFHQTGWDSTQGGSFKNTDQWDISQGEKGSFYFCMVLSSCILLHNKVTIEDVLYSMNYWERTVVLVFSLEQTCSNIKDN